MTYLIYICSAARSGSTFTDMFLGGHPAVGSTGELNFISKSIAINESCSCGVGIRDCQEWIKVFDTYQAIHRFDPRKHPYQLALWDARSSNLIDTSHQTRRRLALIQGRRALLYGREWLSDSLHKLVPPPAFVTNAVDNKFLLVDTISAAWNKTHIVDSSKNAREAVELWKRKPHQVRIILLTRDGRGAYLSRRKSGRSREESLSGWRDYYKRFIPLLKRHVAPNNIFQLKYEDLARAPDIIGAKLCNFVGIDYRSNMPNLGNTTRHMASGNDTRFSATTGIHLDERWRTNLNGEELAYFEKNAGKLNQELGYE